VGTRVNARVKSAKRFSFTETLSPGAKRPERRVMVRANQHIIPALADWGIL
jgi:hypothetical protein